MQLLIVVPAYVPFVGGAQTLCRGLARRLVEDGHRVTVLTTNAQQAEDFWMPPPADRIPLSSHEQMEGVEIVRLPLSYPWPAPYRFGLLRRFSQRLASLPLAAAWQQPLLRHFTRSMPPILGLQSEIDTLAAQAELILVVDAGWDGLFVGAAQTAFSLGKPTIVLPLIHTGSRAILEHFRMAHLAAVYRRAATALALSAPEQALLAGWGVEPARLHCLPVGVQSPGNAETDQRADVPVALPARYFLFLGAATYDKGAFSLALAAEELARQGEDVTIIYAGPQQHRLAVFIDTRPADVRAILKERIRLLGVVDEGTKQKLLAECVALALPSQVDSFGIVILEAWQHAKPVVAAAIGGPAAIVTHEQTGLLVPFDEPLALAAALARILNEAGLAARLGAAGRQIVLNQFTWDKCYDAFHQIAARIYSSQIGRNDERL